MTGQTISHYRILEKLGEGGMGVVWKAEDLLLKRIVALKFLHASDDLPRLLREAQTAGSLNHPNICTIHEVDPERGFLAMELVEGESLSGKIAGRPLPVEEATGLAAQICEGLKAAHDKGIIHRDIKSGNVLVTADGRAKILDFSLARAPGQAALTREGVVCPVVVPRGRTPRLQRHRWSFHHHGNRSAVGRALPGESASRGVARCTVQGFLVVARRASSSDASSVGRRQRRHLRLFPRFAPGRGIGSGALARRPKDLLQLAGNRAGREPALARVLS